MPIKTKRIVLTQEVIRILRNCCLDLPWNEKAVLLSELSVRMKNSGYSEMFRHQVIDSGLKGFDMMMSVAEAGGRPVNGKSSWERLQRKRKKRTKSVNWHKAGGYHVPLFVSNTPNSELTKQIQAIEQLNPHRCIRFKIVETGGTSVKSLL